MENIFLCYRREDTGGWVRSLDEKLSGAYGRTRIFRDVDSVPIGIHFPDHIKRIISSCRVVLVLIGKNWLEAKNEKGQRRLDDPNDWVRIEIGIALSQNAWIVPVLIDGTRMPEPHKLPEALAQLPYLQAIELRDTRWNDDVEYLLSKLEQDSRGKMRKGMTWVSAGDFLCGDPPKTHAMPKGYFIDLYPVTNKQFQQFVESGGYEAREYWSEAGWRWRVRDAISFPKFMRDRDFCLPLQPIVGVSYFEAEAFACWAHKRLPQEKEWEKAARGDDGRRYPWGSDFDSKLCNSLEANVMKTSSVNRFPQGTSPYDCRDMAGNVWEWTTSPAPDEIGYQIIRGGSWRDTGQDVSATARWILFSQNREKDVGFRCVQDETA